MRLDSLKHIARAVSAMLDGDRLIVYREKDRCQIQFLINSGYLDPERLKRRVSDVDLTPKMVVKVHQLLDSVLEAF